MNENYNITLLNTESDKLPENLRITVYAARHIEDTMSGLAPVQFSV